MKNLYFIEVTDTFGGEANYSWVTRHVITASTMRGAVGKFSRLSGMSWRINYGGNFDRRYDSKSGATCYFIRQFDADYDADYDFDTDERK